MALHSIRIWGLEGIPEVHPGDNLCELILGALGRESGVPNSVCETSIPPGTIFVVAQKIISKAEDRIISLDTIAPSRSAKIWASQHRRDPRLVEVVLRESKRIVRMDKGVLIVETLHGFICANGGVDASNAPKGCVVLLPTDPDYSARQLLSGLEIALQVPTAVIISDTFGRPWRQGQTNVALGIAGLSPFVDYRGQVDFSGRPLRSTVLAVADELASAAELVMGKTRRIPVAIIEGFGYAPGEGTGRELVRPAHQDLFR